MKFKNVFILGLIGFFLTAASSAFAQGVKTGEAAPEFTLLDTKGKEVSLASYRGQYVVLEWLNHSCPFVVKHYDAGNMQNLQKEYAKEDVVWLSINSSASGKEGNVTAEEANKLTAEKNATPTAVLLDTDGKVGRLYNARTTPHMFVIDPNGIVIYQGAIDSIKSFDQKDIPGAKNYVKAAFDEVFAGKKVSEGSTEPYGCAVKY